VWRARHVPLMSMSPPLFLTLPYGLHIVIGPIIFIEKNVCLNNCRFADELQRKDRESGLSLLLSFPY
jgi:hypothetical protein